MNSPLVAAIEQRLRQAGYDVSLNVELPAAVETGARHGYVPVRPAISRREILFLLEVLLLCLAEYFRG